MPGGPETASSGRPSALSAGAPGAHIACRDRIVPLAILCTRRAPGLQDVPLPGEGEQLTGVRCVTRVESRASALLVLLARKNETLSHTLSGVKGCK